MYNITSFYPEVRIQPHENMTISYFTIKIRHDTCLNIGIRFALILTMILRSALILTMKIRLPHTV